MHFFPSKPFFFVILMVGALLIACATGDYYAPVKTDSNKTAGQKQNPLLSKQELNKDKLVDNGDLRKYQGGANLKNSRSTGLSSGYGYQGLAHRNQKLSSNNSSNSINIKHPDFEDKVTDKAQKNATSKRLDSLTKSVNPVTNKANSEHGSTHKKQQTEPEVAIKPKMQEKKSIGSIDNKKMLKFGWPIDGKILKSFSPSRNKGIDIAGRQEQSVKATEAGRVVYGGQGLIGFGKLLVIKHNEVYLSAYANNRRLLVNEGESVQKGQVIAKVGDAGIKRTSLHFEIRENGKPVNPLKLLPKK